MGQKTTILAIGLIIFAVILAILFIVSRVIGGGNNTNSEKAETTNNVQEVESVDENIQNDVSVSKILATPNVYEGYAVTVTSNVSGWATNKAFYFMGESSGLFASQSRGTLLVVSGEPFQLPDSQNDEKLGLGETSKITATGKIVIMSREEVETALGVNLDDPKLELGNQAVYKWRLGPVLLMESYSIPEVN